LTCFVQLKNVSKIYNKGQANECIALNNINLEINKGDYITVWGTNGAGKTSLLDTLSKGGITDGYVFLNGVDITKMQEHKRARFVGRITQNPFEILAESLTLEENLALAFHRDKAYTLRKGITRNFKEMIKHRLSDLKLGLEKRLGENVYNLSGGERQAITILMATLSAPKLLLLDEHTAALDLEKTKLIENLTDSVVLQNGITTLWVTHKKEQAARFGNRILFLKKGKIVKDLSMQDKHNISEKNMIDILERFQLDTVPSEDTSNAAVAPPLTYTINNTKIGNISSNIK